jgi:hypothetical protein
MIIYGDRDHCENAASICAKINAMLDDAVNCDHWSARHDMLVGAFIEMGKLSQAVADLQFARRGLDEVDTERDACDRVLLRLAALVETSWRCSSACMKDELQCAKAAILQLDLQQFLRLREPEGYGYYAVYPECYIEAARRSGLGPDLMVIGIRSIGTGLAAIVAAAVGSRSLTTVRPFGHPFARKVAIGPRLATFLISHQQGEFAIVDEGPGLSGSSFAAVARWLSHKGIDENRIHFFPSHDNAPGPMAEPETRRLWRNANRHVIAADDLILYNPRRADVIAGIEHDIGPLQGPPIDIGAGAWRAKAIAATEDWPPVDCRFERRKFLVLTANGSWLAKFAGLGRFGQEKYARARALAEAGFCPPVSGLYHGFTLERFLQRGPVVIEREHLIRRIARYLSFRAVHLVPSTSGASLVDLRTMARTNCGELLGSGEADLLCDRLGGAEELEALVVPADIDGRLHAWEWLVDCDGVLRKTDAVDHGCGHDLVGHQDASWDLAGAIVEFDLDAGEMEILFETFHKCTARAVHRGLVDFLTLCYLAFQAGLWTSAMDGALDEEKGRIGRLVERYVHKLGTLIAEPCARP